MENVNRRSLVKGAALASAGLAAAALACRRPKAALAAEGVAFDEEGDVLVVGSGYSGLAAAYEAAAAGADVKVVEKLAVVGGNSLVADGDFAVCGSAGQKAKGIEDSVEKYVHDMQVAGLFLNDVEKCRVIAERSNETWEWTRDVLGTEWQTDEETGEAKPIPYGGHSVMRTLHPVSAHGASIVLPLQERLSEMGVEVQTETMLANLVKDGNGRVVGAELRAGASNNDVTTGEPLYVKARRGVVLASGGFGRDVEWRMQHDPRLDGSVDCTNAAGATAESLCTAIECGALPVHLDWIQCGPWCSPDEEGYGVGPTWIDSVAGYAPSIDPRTGERCVNELTDRKRYCDVIFEVGEPRPAREVPGGRRQLAVRLPRGARRALRDARRRLPGPDGALQQDRRGQGRRAVRQGHPRGRRRHRRRALLRHPPVAEGPPHHGRRQDRRRHPRARRAPAAHRGPLRRRRGHGRRPRRLPPGLLRHGRLPGQRPHRRPEGRRGRARRLSRR